MTDVKKKYMKMSLFLSISTNKKMSLLTQCPETDLYVLIQNVPFKSRARDSTPWSVGHLVGRLVSRSVRQLVTFFKK